jgi:hypothetical protein
MQLKQRVTRYGVEPLAVFGLSRSFWRINAGDCCVIAQVREREIADVYD